MTLRRVIPILGIVVLSCLFASIAPQQAQAAPTTLNFDDVDHATNITNDHYSYLGVRIEDTQFWNGIALIGHFTICPNNYRLQNDYYYYAPPYQILTTPTINPLTGVKETPTLPPPPPKPPAQNMLALDADRPNTIRFINGQVSDQVSFNVINENGASTAYQALDVSGNVISQGQVQGNPCGGVPVTLTKGSSSGINAVRFWRTGQGNVFAAGPGFIGIDDVTFDLAPPAVVTPPPPAPAPTPPPGAFSVSAQASCSSITTVQVNLTWTASVDSSPLAGTPQYQLATLDNGQYTPLPATSALSYTYTEPAGVWATRTYSLSTSNAGGTTYAAASSGTTDLGNSTFSVALPACAPPPPGPFTATAATSCSGSTPVADVSWTVSAGATTYRLYDTSEPKFPALLGTFNTPPGAPVRVNLSASTANFTVDASNDGGSSTATITTKALDCAPQASITLAPINSVCSAGQPSNLLTWSSSDGSASTLGDFTIFRDGTQISTTTSTSYTDSTATSGTTYSYTVQSGSTTSNAQSILTTTCPQPPANFQLTLASMCTGITSINPANSLSWTISNGADSYVVQRDGQPIRSVAKNTTGAVTETLLDTDVTSGTTYTYVVDAINAIGTISSNTVPIQTTSCSIALPPNGPPVANDDTATTDPATKVNVIVLANDTDPDGNLDPTTVRITQNPTNGLAVVTPNGTIDYTPTAGFAGTDTLTYEVCDTEGLCDTALVTITVNALPTPPPPLPGPLTLSAQPLCAGQLPQNTLSWTASDKADNYTVRRGTQTLTSAPITTTSYLDGGVTNGTTYVYTIDAKNAGGTTSSNQLTITTANCTPIVPVTPPVQNLPPVASDDTATTPQDKPVTIDVLANDVDPEGKINPACTAITSPAAHGTTTINLLNGRITYTPTTGFSGTDSFAYQMCDDQGLTDTATVTVVVQAPAPTPPPSTPPPTPATNLPPHANDDATTTPHNKPIEINILANDSDPDGNLDPTCVKITKQPGHGTVAVNAVTGKATYSPAADFAGTDSFQYTVCDKLNAVSNTATVSIAVNEAPPAALATTGIPIFGFLVDLWNRFLTFIGLR